jgi:hypothetical protein
MQTTRIIGAVVCAFMMSACNDVSRSANEAADARNTASLSPRHETQETLPQAVPVPPASSSAVVTGNADAPVASAETPVGTSARPDPSAPVSAATDSNAPAPGSDTPPTASSNPDGTKTSTDSAATTPAEPLTREEESKSMPLAGHGNNHSSPALEQGAKN